MYWPSMSWLRGRSAPLGVIALASSLGRSWYEHLARAELVQADAPQLGVEELFNFLASQPFAASGREVRVCFFGVGERTAALGARFLMDASPPPAHVVFLRAESEARSIHEKLAVEFPGRVHVASSIDMIGDGCTVVVLAVEDPRFNVEDIRAVAPDNDRVLLAYLAAHCNYERSHECRFFHNTWDALTEGAASCGRDFCVATVAVAALVEPLLDSVDCSAATAVGGALALEKPPSSSSQWQQDWFVYQNFVRGTSKDSSPYAGKQDSTGIFVDVGAFHPVHLSNTVFFERCLGWRGICVEPNPGFAPQFRAYRPKCQLVRNCVWSRPRQVVMSFQKDPIEAYIKDDEEYEATRKHNGTRNDKIGSSGAVLIQGGGARPEFKAECRTLQDILTSAGLQKPVVVDYLSVDAEAAEAEIFRVFPFEEFDISVISVEVQVQNYYELDVVLLSAGYVKVAVLGGDHVYHKLRRATKLPARAAEWHQSLIQDFYTHAAPKTSTLTK